MRVKELRASRNCARKGTVCVKETVRVVVQENRARSATLFSKKVIFRKKCFEKGKNSKKIPTNDFYFQKFKSCASVSPAFSRVFRGIGARESGFFGTFWRGN